MASAAATTVTMNAVTMPDYIYPQTFDNLLLDFTLTPAVADSLKALTVKNEGSARDFYDINRLVLWTDAGKTGFQGFAVDTEVAAAAYDDSSNLWVFSGLNDSVPASGKRYFVTVETKAGATSGRSFVFNLQAKYDANADGVYQSGDAGVYFGSKTVIPTDTQSGGATRMSGQTYDVYKPVAVMTNLSAGQEITASTYKIVGKSKDQGGTGVKKLEVCIDAVCADGVNTDGDYSTWEYSWANIAAGSHEVYAKATDNSDNVGQTEKITVSKPAAAAVNNEIALSDSIVTISKTKALADAIDKISVSLSLKNTAGEYLANQTIYMQEKRVSGEVVIKSKDTGADGYVNFDVLSDTAGLFTLRLVTPEGLVIKPWFDVQFSKNNIDWTAGRFVKTASSAAVYLLDGANVRHAYPTAAVWNSYFAGDFSKVETISTAEMATYNLGRNVPMKVGTMIKLTTVNKVYRVEPDATIKWITTEEGAVNLYGVYWAMFVKDMPDAFWSDYAVGAALE